MAITLAELRTNARQRADMESSEFVSDSELTSYVNASIAELYDILIQSYGEDYFVEDFEFDTTEGSDTYELPDDLYKLIGVDVRINGVNFITIQKYNFDERNTYGTVGFWTVSGIPAIRYRMIGSNIRFSPVPDRATRVKLWYIPLATKLVADDDELNDLNQYSEYVVVDAAIKMLQKEESDVQVLLLQKQALIKRITEASENRDAANSDSISDIYNENDEYYFRR